MMRAMMFSHALARVLPPKYLLRTSLVNRMGRVLAAKNEGAMGETSKQETEKEEQKGRKRKAPMNKEATGEVEKESKMKRPVRGAAAKQDSAAAKQNVDAEMPEAKPKRPVRGSAAKESVVVEKEDQEEAVEHEAPKARRQARGAVAAAAAKQKKVDASKPVDAVGEKEDLADGKEQEDEKAEQQMVETPKRRGRSAKAVNAKKEDVKKEMDQVPVVSDVNVNGGGTVAKDQEEVLSKDEDAQNAENAIVDDKTAVQKQQPTLDVPKKRGRTAKAQKEEVKKEAVDAAVAGEEDPMTNDQKESEANDAENDQANVPAEHDQEQKPVVTEKAKQKEDDDKEQEKKQPGRKRKVVQLLKEEPMEDEDVTGEQEVPEKETVKRSRDSKIKKEKREMQEDEEAKKKTRGKKAVAVEKVEEDTEKTTEEDGKEEESAEKETKLNEAPKVNGRGRKKEKVEVTEESKEESAPVAESSTGRRRGKQETVKTSEKAEEDKEEEKEEEEKVDAKVTQKKKKEIVAVESDAQKLLRTTIGAEVIKAAGNSEKYLGVHVSGAGSLEQAIYNARAIGCRSFAFFTRSSRTWKLAPMEDEVVERWNQVIQETSYPLDKILPHGSYLMNPASPKEEILVKSRECLLHECQRAEKLGIKHYNFHPGSTVGECTVEEACRTVSESINYVHKNTNDVILVIETMARQGHTVGGSFTELALMIEGVDDKKRVGVCIDTCHVFAAGYEFNTTAGYDAMMKEFEEKIGFEYLKGFHVNDSKDKCGMRKDRHELIGKGNIKVDGFRRMMNDDRLNGIPMILETPDTGDNYPKEMILLHSLEEGAEEEEESKTKKAKKVTMAADVDEPEEEELKEEEVEVPAKKKRGAASGQKRKGKK